MAAVTKNGVGKHLVHPAQIDIENLTGEDIFVTQLGFKLKVNPVPLDVIIEARNRVPMPEAPLIPVKDEDGKIIEGKFDQNFVDPKYIKAMDSYQDIIKRLTFQIMSAYGITAYAIPEGLYGPDDEGWVDLLGESDIFTVDGVEGSFGITVPDVSRPRARLAEWLRLYVLTQKDGEVINEVFLRGAGAVMEKDVEEAVDSFPDR